MGYGIVALTVTSSRKNRRRGAEHGSAQWGDVFQVAKRYRDKKHPKEKDVYKRQEQDVPAPETESPTEEETTVPEEQQTESAEETPVSSTPENGAVSENGSEPSSQPEEAVPVSYTHLLQSPAGPGTDWRAAGWPRAG